MERVKETTETMILYFEECKKIEEAIRDYRDKETLEILDKDDNGVRLIELVDQKDKPYYIQLHLMEGGE